MLERLNADLAREAEDVAETEQSAANLEAVLADLQEELKATKRQRIRDIMKHPEQEDTLEVTYDELESDLLRRMEGLQNQIAMTVDKRNTIIQVNRVAKTAMEVFDDILNKSKLDRNDLQLIIRKIRVFEDRIEIQLKSDIDSILRSGALPAEREIQITQESDRHQGKIFTVRVVSNGDPLEIYTSRDGEVIFKKYSLMGGLDDFAAQFCETLSKSTGALAAVTDRDTVIAVAGGGKRDLLGKRLSSELEQIMEDRKIYQQQPGERCIFVTDTGDKYCAAVAAPIISEGDALGLVLFVSDGDSKPTGETEYKLAQTIAAFLGKHMEN